ncbi:DUF3604 domain-containing protein [Chloroflexota bacterium]
MLIFNLGKAQIYPKGDFEAGAFTTVTYTYTAKYPIDDSGYIKIVFRQMGDFGIPQFNNPDKPNYCTVYTSGNCRIVPTWENRGHIRPWHLSLFLKVTNGFLGRGERVVVIFGDCSRGSQGWQMQTFCEGKFKFKTLVDPIATFQFTEIAKSPIISIVPGSPARAFCIAPSQIQVQTAFNYHVKVEDKWGNPICKPIKKQHSGFELTGVYTITATDEKTGLSAKSNPIKAVMSQEYIQPWWADLHGQTEETVGTNTIEDYYRFARDYGLLDIAAHQGNDFQITDDFWRTINETADKFYKKGQFVTFPGYEWSGSTPLGGDRNVYFTSRNEFITRSGTELLPEQKSNFKDSPTAVDLFKNLKRQPVPTFVFAHAGGRYSNLDMHDPDIEIAVEVHSAWGTFEWLVEDAIKKGYRIGICANSDGHKCRPGSSYPGATQFGSLGGLTCILSEALDRPEVYKALKARHFYATTGNRTLISLQLTDDSGMYAIMGDVVKKSDGTPILYGRIAANSPVESIAVNNGLEIVKTIRPYGNSDLGNRIKIIWGGAEHRGRERYVRWDGRLIANNNRILDATGINFWNENQPLRMIGSDQLEWESVTTGGIAGIIIRLEKRNQGSFKLETYQGNIEIDDQDIEIEPKRWNYGEIKKRIEIFRLPNRLETFEYSFDFPLTSLHAGDNPVYIKIIQEDGHMAWTSPIYLMVNGEKEVS